MWTNLLGKIIHWKQLSLTGDETVINLQRVKVHVFSDFVLCLGKVYSHLDSNEVWIRRIERIINEKSYRDYDGIDGEPTEFEWNIFPGFDTLQFCGKVTELLSSSGEEPETFTGRILFMSMFNDISCGTKDNEREFLANSKVVSILAKKFGTRHLLVQVPKRSGLLWKRTAHRELRITSRTTCCWIAESECPIFRATTPLSVNG